jgi:hypothetical protein
MSIIEDAKQLVTDRAMYGTKMGSVLVTNDGTNEASIPGFPYVFRAEGDKILVSVDIFKSGYECQVCKGSGKVEIKQRRDMVLIDCVSCKGKGALLHLADESKTLPTTGVIVSIGDEVKNKNLVCGSRVLFGCYTGVMIPTKAPGIVFKILRDIEVLCTIKGGEEASAFDFLVVDKEL